MFRGLDEIFVVNYLFRSFVLHSGRSLWLDLARRKSKKDGDLRVLTSQVLKIVDITGNVPFAL